jgi:cyclophilin family peptidyl-prolyl cis-trans isomerase
MAVQERDFMKSSEPADAPPAGAGWLARVNAFGERHATLIITLSTVLIILTVLVFAKGFYDRAQVERAEQELADAESAEKLLELKGKYGSTPVGPRIQYRLANRYYEDGKLEAARNEYREFASRYPHHPLQEQVERAMRSLESNLKFLESQKEVRLKQARLQTHPSQLSAAKDPRLQWGPKPEPRPAVEFDFGKGPVKVELFEDEAPQAVAHFVKLSEEKYWEGAKLDVVGDRERLHVLPKADPPLDYTLPFEPTSRPGDPYVLALVRKEGAPENLAGQFQILLKSVADLKDVTVFGAILEGSPNVMALTKDDTVKAAKVVSKRDHPYVPQTLPKK